MLSQLTAALRFLRENDLRTITGYLLSHDAHPTIQFLKYVTAGVIATVMHQGIFFSLAYTIFPAGDGMMVNGLPIDNDTRYWNSIINNCIAFFPVIIVVYWLNVKWVFKPGRHSWVKEFLLFLGVAAVGNAAGIIGGPKLIDWFGIPTWMSQATFIVTSFLVNFICRKFVIFKG